MRRTQTGRARGVLLLVLVSGYLSLPTTTSFPVARAAFPGMSGKIVFVRAGNIWSMRADGSGKRQITFFSNGEEAGAPQWSPDGRRIAFQACLEYPDGENCDIWTMRANGSQMLRVTKHPASEDHPAWSPDGGWLAFTSDRTGDFRVYRLRSKDPFGVPIPVGDKGCSWMGCDLLYDSELDWSPDGSTIAFQRQALLGCPCYEDWLVLVPAWTPGAAETLIRGRYAPDWSPDGTRIAVSVLAWNDNSSDSADGSNIFHMAPDGSDLIAVTHFPALNGSGRRAFMPAWSPSGDQILFTAWVRGIPSVFRVAPDGTSPPVRLARRAREPDWQPRPS